MEPETRQALFRWAKDLNIRTTQRDTKETLRQKINEEEQRRKKAIEDEQRQKDQEILDELEEFNANEVLNNADEYVREKSEERKQQKEYDEFLAKKPLSELSDEELEQRLLETAWKNQLTKTKLKLMKDGDIYDRVIKITNPPLKLMILKYLKILLKKKTKESVLRIES